MDCGVQAEKGGKGWFRLGSVPSLCCHNNLQTDHNCLVLRRESEVRLIGSGDFLARPGSDSFDSLLHRPLGFDRITWIISS